MAQDAASDHTDTDLDRAIRSEQNRANGLKSWTRTTDRAARTLPARTAFRRKFLDEVDPDRVLPEAVRAQQADAAFKAYMAELNVKAMKAKRLKKAS